MNCLKCKKDSTTEFGIFVKNRVPASFFKSNGLDINECLKAWERVFSDKKANTKDRFCYECSSWMLGNLMSAIHKIFIDKLFCCICFERVTFDNWIILMNIINTTNGKIYECNHTLCKQCCETLIEHSSQCPICRREINYYRIMKSRSDIKVIHKQREIPSYYYLPLSLNVTGTVNNNIFSGLSMSSRGGVVDSRGPYIPNIIDPQNDSILQCCTYLKGICDQRLQGPLTKFATYCSITQLSQEEEQVFRNYVSFVAQNRAFINIGDAYDNFVNTFFEILFS